jgi:hypothetical protein
LQSSDAKKGRSGGQDAEPGQRHVFLAGGFGGIAHEAFQHGEIVEKAASARFGQAAGGVRPVALIAPW